MFLDPDYRCPKTEYMDEHFDKVTIQDLIDGFDLDPNDLEDEDLEALKQELLEDMWETHQFSIERDKCYEAEMCEDPIYF